MVISNVEGVGGPVKLLGVQFDNKLIMNTASTKCAKKAAFKLKSLLRCRRFYSTVDLVMLYKSHVLSFIEYRTPALHFASSSVLNEIDDVQVRFVREIGLSEEFAFMSFNLAPLQVRRDIAMLGVIHRAASRSGPPQLWRFFQRTVSDRGGRPSRNVRHSLQVSEWAPGRNLEIMRRSALGMIRVYNLLAQETVEQQTMKDFQKSLTNLVRDRVVARDSRWKVLLSCRHPLFQRHPLVCADRR